MKKFISTILSLILFLTGSCSVFAGGVNKVEILSDGTKLTYVSTDKLPEVSQRFKNMIEENRARNFSLAGNLSIKAATIIGVGLLEKLESRIENKYLRNGLRISTFLIGLLIFFYPEYVRHDVDYVENKGMKIHGPFMYDDYDIKHNSTIKGLAGFLGDIDRHIRLMQKEPDNEIYQDGFIIVERPKLSNESFNSGVYFQDSSEPSYLRDDIEESLKWE